MQTKIDITFYTENDPLNFQLPVSLENTVKDLKDKIIAYCNQQFAPKKIARLSLFMGGEGCRDDKKLSEYREYINDPVLVMDVEYAPDQHVEQKRGSTNLNICAKNRSVYVDVYGDATIQNATDEFITKYNTLPDREGNLITCTLLTAGAALDPNKKISDCKLVGTTTVRAVNLKFEPIIKETHDTALVNSPPTKNQEDMVPVKLEIDNQPICINIALNTTIEVFKKAVIDQYNTTRTAQISKLEIFGFANKAYTALKNTDTVASFHNNKAYEKICGVPVCATPEEILTLQQKSVTKFVLPEKTIANPQKRVAPTGKTKHYVWILLNEETLKNKRIDSEFTTFDHSTGVYKAASNRKEKDKRNFDGGFSLELKETHLPSSKELFEESKVMPPVLEKCFKTGAFYFYSKNKQSEAVFFEMPKEFNEKWFNEPRLKLTHENNKNTSIAVTENGNFKKLFSKMREFCNTTQKEYTVFLKAIINVPNTGYLDPSLNSFFDSLNPSFPWIIRFNRDKTTEYVLYYKNKEGQQHLDVIKDPELIKALSTRNFDDSWKINLSSKENSDIFDAVSPYHSFCTYKKWFPAAVVFYMNQVDTFEATTGMTYDDIEKKLNAGKIKIENHEQHDPVLLKDVGVGVHVYQKNAFVENSDYKILAYLEKEKDKLQYVIPVEPNDPDLNAFKEKHQWFVLNNTEAMRTVVTPEKRVESMGSLVLLNQFNPSEQTARISLLGIHPHNPCFTIKMYGPLYQELLKTYPDMNLLSKALPSVQTTVKIWGGEKDKYPIGMEFQLKASYIPNSQQLINHVKTKLLGSDIGEIFNENQNYLNFELKKGK